MIFFKNCTRNVIVNQVVFILADCKIISKCNVIKDSQITKNLKELSLSVLYFEHFLYDFVVFLQYIKIYLTYLDNVETVYKIFHFASECMYSIPSNPIFWNLNFSPFFQMERYDAFCLIVNYYPCDVSFVQKSACFFDFFTVFSHDVCSYVVVMFVCYF